VLGVANFEFDDHALLVAEWPSGNPEWERCCPAGRGIDSQRYCFGVGALWEPIQCNVGARRLEPDTPYGLRAGRSVKVSSKAIHHPALPYVDGIEGYDLFDRLDGIRIADLMTIREWYSDAELLNSSRVSPTLSSVSNPEKP
jgi:hypothetical protein